MARGDQSFLPLGASGAGRGARPAGRVPMREDAPPPHDPDKPYRTLYALLTFALSACTSPEELARWAADHRHAFDELAAGSPDRVAALRKIYALHRDNLRPATVAPGALNRPPPALPAGLVGLGGQEGSDAGTED